MKFAGISYEDLMEEMLNARENRVLGEEAAKAFGKNVSADERMAHHQKLVDYKLTEERIKAHLLHMLEYSKVEMSVHE